MEEKLLYDQNPWWLDALTIQKDLKIRQFSENLLKFTPKPIFEKNEPGILTLRGPRQVGKSTAIKLAIRELLLSGEVNPHQIFFYSMEDIAGRENLADLLKTYQGICVKQKIDNQFRYIFLDEISFVSDWELAIKQLYEQGMFQQTVVLITGSNARDLHHQAERLPGRRGNYNLPDKIFFPLSFREYLEVRNYPYLDKIPNLSHDEIMRDVNKCQNLMGCGAIVDSLNLELESYFFTGGFLTAINDIAKNGHILPTTYQTYLQWIRGDIIKMGRNEHVAREALIGIRNRLGSSFGWNTLKELVADIYSGNIVDYLWIFTEIFVAKFINQLDTGKLREHPKKQKKVYFIDPLLFWTIFYWERKWAEPFSRCMELLPNVRAGLVENLIASHFFRFDELDWFSSRTHFWQGFKEIDFLFVNELQKAIPCEVKYQNKIEKSDFNPMVKAGFKNGVVFSKNTLAKPADGFFAIPTALFLSLPRGA